MSVAVAPEADIDTDVLVVGAGPTGLLLAADLRRRGIDCRVIEKNDGPAQHSKAMAVQARSIEIFERMGLAEPVLKQSLRIDRFHIHLDNDKALQVPFAEVQSPFPHVYMLAQDRTERILLDHLRRHDGAVSWGHTLEGLEDSAARSVTATVRHGDATETIRARYVVGCDGAHSTVRHLLDLPFEGHGYPETFCVADVRLDHAPELMHEERHFSGHLKEQRLLLVFPLHDDQYRIVTIDPQRAETDEAPDEQELQDLCDQVRPGHVRIREVVWSSWFHVHCRTVTDFRKGPVFLAGDAAHIHSPAGGQGMNTGLQDAYNLAWKLARVLDGRAPSALLDTYHSERHPVALRVLNSTDRLFSVGMARNPVTRFARNHLAPKLLRFEKPRRTLARFVSQTEIRYKKNRAVEDQSDRQVAQPRSERGVKAGLRAPDAGLLDAAGMPVALRHLLTDDRYTLIIFHGSSHHGRADPVAIDAAHWIEDHVGDDVRVVAVQPGHHETTKVDPHYEDSAISGSFLDPDGVAHGVYGAHDAKLVLVRPDGHIGFTSMWPDLKELRAHLTRNMLLVPDEKPRKKLRMRRLARPRRKTA